MDGRQPEHTPRRPDWVCRDCGEPWPCPTRRDMLLDEMRVNPLAVVLYLAACFEEASSSLDDPTGDAVYSRMFGWIGDRGSR
ncbi:hypothetical protein GCM10009557_76110 [Virgisporangium ochraceum]|uniref:Flavin reductase n=2 Tax=Virgisporangium ochraceum TaxID=65505 RepID=A0A8J3ZPR2_9ACTN|nr:hypothetical protein [Virgisporangium ochraceum]GIJ68119.1 hypothetical protein Voc01_030360 [Virgisporangium ochraceum]